MLWVTVISAGKLRRHRGVTKTKVKNVFIVSADALDTQKIDDNGCIDSKKYPMGFKLDLRNEFRNYLKPFNGSMSSFFSFSGRTPRTWVDNNNLKRFNSIIMHDITYTSGSFSHQEITM